VIAVRRLNPDELALAPSLLKPEGWDFEPEELARLHRLGGAVGALSDGKLVGFLTTHDEPPVRWIGNVVVAPDVRGSGLGARLLDEAMRGHAGTVGLYSVERAVTLYARAGFVAQGEAFLLRAETAVPKRAGRAEDLRAADLTEVVRFDRDATGMDRRALLHELVRAYPKTLRIVRRDGRVAGFGVAKTSGGGTEIGPVVARDAATRDALLDELLEAAPPPYEATALGASPGVMEALDERGFAVRFRTIPMFRGPPPAWRPELLVAAAGLEKG
jgi:GNAT superfamily N-acetyltransferase